MLLVKTLTFRMVPMLMMGLMGAGAELAYA